MLFRSLWLNCSTNTGRSGRGPTMLMSPMSTLMNWGSSSNDERRRKRPSGVARLSPRLAQMGTTLVTLLITPDAVPTAHFAHVGDSRGYLFRDGRLTQSTTDHTLIETYIARGVLTPAKAKTHPERHVLTRAIGVSRTAKPDFTAYPLHPADILLLCSDGLTKMLEDTDIAEIMGQAQGDPIRICDRLIDCSLARGGEDNVTVIVVSHP